jgi:hypothetical protein
MSRDGDGFATVATAPGSQASMRYEDIMTTLMVTDGSRHQGRGQSPCGSDSSNDYTSFSSAKQLDAHVPQCWMDSAAAVFGFALDILHIVSCSECFSRLIR